MFLPAPVDINRSVGVPATAHARTIPSSSTHSTVGDESRRWRTRSNAGGLVAVRPAAANAVDAIPSQSAALIYTIGMPTPQFGAVSHLGEFAAHRGWQLAGVHADAESAHTSKRPGLAAALAQLRVGTAAVLVLDQRTKASTPDRLSLRITVQHVGGMLCVAADDVAGKGEVAAMGFETVAAFVQIVSPLELCREDAG